MTTVFKKLDVNAKNFFWVDGLVLVYAFYLFYSQFSEFVMNNEGAFRPDGILDNTIPGIATLLMFGSNIFNNMIEKSADAGNVSRMKNQFLLTIIMGLVFIGIIGYEIGYYSGINFGTDFSIFSNTYHMMVRLFIGHIALGVIVHFISYFRLEMNEAPEKNAKLIAFATTYWNMLTYFWLILFVTLYLI